MRLKYYPQSRIVQSKYTNGNEYQLSDGTSYTGRYYTLYDGKSYTGANPVYGKGDPLTAITKGSSRLSFRTSPSQTQSRASAKSDTQLTALTPYYPTALPSEYQQGYFTRYFAKTVTGPQFIVEISPGDFANLKDGEASTAILGYQSTSMLWQLTGPLNNTRVSQYQVVGGVYDTNKRVTEAKEATFFGIVSYIGGDYTKFAQITSGSVANSGSM